MIISFSLVILNILSVQAEAVSVNNYRQFDRQHVDKQNQQDKSQALSDECQLIPKQEASRTAQLETGGKVIDIKLNSNDKDSTYRVRVLIDEKRVKNITLDACR